MNRAYSFLIALLLTNTAWAATTTLIPSADAYVQAGANAAANFGTATTLRIQTSTTAAGNYDSYLKFDTTSVTGTISNAKLRIYTKLTTTGTVTTTAYAAPSAWTEAGINWNNKPARGAALGSVIVNSTTYAYKDIDVTAYVQSEYAANRKVISFAYHNSANTSPYITAYSKNSTSANKPQLLVTYTTNAAPSVSISNPTAGVSFIAPASITLNANATDSDGTITKVEFYNGATLLNTDIAAPYSYNWTGVAPGAYSITAKATDNANAITTSSPISITVSANAAPTVSLLAPSPSDSFTAPATLSLVANAADSDGAITKVEFYQGNSLLGSATQSPYLYDWVNAPAGSYSLTAKATDNANVSTTSSAVNITVNAAPAPPGIYYVYADHLNTPRVITDTSNKTVWRWDSDPFGTDVASEDVDGDGRRFSYNHRFPGQYWDKETGLNYNGFRDYDSSTGRYIQSDPLGLFGGSFSTYGYANQNPLSFTDPFGLNASTIIRGILEGIVVGGAAGNSGGNSTSNPGSNSPPLSGIPRECRDADCVRNAREERNNTNSEANNPSSSNTGNICKPGKPDVLPGDLCAQLALAEAKGGAGVPIMGAMSDAPRLVAIYGPGPWIKKQHTHICPDGRKLVIHYFSNSRGTNVELKFV